MRKMKDSGIPWIGEIPTDWTISRVKNEFLNLDYLREPISAEKRDNKLGLYDYYGASGAIDKIDQYNVDDTVLLIGEDGANLRMRNLPLIYRASGKLWVNNHAHILKVKPDNDYSYMAHLLETGDYSVYITGSAQPKLSQFNLMNFQIVVPPANEQIVIAEYLDLQCAGIDTVLHKTRTSIEEYQKLKQAIITQAVTKGVRGDRPMKESGIEWAPSIPEDWSSYRGKQVFYETNERSETGSEELLTVSHKTGITPRSQKNVNMFMSESLVGYKICREGDIAANTMWMWQGAIGVSAYHGVISPSYNTYRQRNNAFDSQYLDYLLRIPPLVGQYNVCSTGITASRLRLYPEQFLSLRFIVPPMEEQQEIVEFLHSRVDEMDALIQKKAQFLAELESYKKSLVYEYVTGKKGV